MLDQPMKPLYGAMIAIYTHPRRTSNYDDGRFAWHFAVVYRLLTPVAARGSLGLWEWVIPDACRQELEAAVEPCGQQEGRGA